MSVLTKYGFRWLGCGAMLAFAVGLSGCGGGYVYSGGGTDPYYSAWYDVYGNYCGTTPTGGCDFYADGTKIQDYQDPYYSTNYVLVYNYYTYYDSYGYGQSYTGWAWLSPDNILYDDFGNALNTLQQSGGRDLEGDVAAKQEQVIQQAGKGLAAEYPQLAEAQGIRIARTLNSWATLGKTRGRTTADVADFSQRLYGVSMEKAEAALNMARTGDLSGIQSVNTDVAKYWNTGPDTSKQILSHWYSEQINAAGMQGKI